MKKIYTLFILSILLPVLTLGQIKVFNNGNIGIGNLTATPITKLRLEGDFQMPSPAGSFSIQNISYNNNQSGITYLCRDLDNQKGIRIYERGDSHFHSRNYDDWGNQTLVRANKDLSKCWIVENLDKPTNDIHTFYVLGDGSVVSKNRYLKKALIKQQQDGTVENALDAILNISTLRQVNGQLEKLGLDYDDLLANIPEATTSLENGERFIDYDVIVPVLVEALKTQQQSIINLETAVEDLSTLVENISNPFGLGSLKNSNPEQQDVNNTIIKNTNSSSLSEQEFKNSSLNQNSPNPFNEKTTIEYHIDSIENNAEILVFDLQGNLLLTKHLAPYLGNGITTISANELRPGMFIYSLLIDGEIIDTKRMILTK